MTDWKTVNKYRVREGMFASQDSDGFNGAFCLVINGLPVKCIVSNGLGWEHVSVSIHGSNLPPSWSIMCQVKELFWGNDVWVVEFHPTADAYVNNHPGCLHLWRPLNEKLPMPPSETVGKKEYGDLSKNPQNIERAMVDYVFGNSKPHA